MSFLYQIFQEPALQKALKDFVLSPDIVKNLKFNIRPYQEEAFQRFCIFDSLSFPEKQDSPFHLLYNMATGSGKTLVMAGLMLHLYKKGYRNFLFFVHSNNIIQKTKDNFLNPQASKYLFSNAIRIHGKPVFIKEVNNFEEADEENINIKFTTIQQLHSDLNNSKEDSITYEDFSQQKLVLIADEAHHLSSRTKQKRQKENKENWEETVLQILQKHRKNLLLEFTATLDYKNEAIVKKYKNKVLFRYDLSQFRADKYSKEIHLIRSHYEEENRILQALILNLYRQVLANSKGINLKPVILFKAKKTIKESERNKENFHRFIAGLSIEKIQKLRATAEAEIIQKAFHFFENFPLSDSQILQYLKQHFRAENCISANNDKEAEKNQLLLNSLEDENNPIRAVFAVQKLNEGWDVLNLFDIVRLYEGRDGKSGKPGKTTLSEAQLIGRGARYYPFALSSSKRSGLSQQKYTRKFDQDEHNDLKVLETLYYHSKEDSRYISELKKALIQSGVYEDKSQFITKTFALSPDFKNSLFYRHGKIFLNQRIKKWQSQSHAPQEREIPFIAYTHIVSSGKGSIAQVFSEKAVETASESSADSKIISFSDLPKPVVQQALSRDSFFHFNSLLNYFPGLSALSDFYKKDAYLGKIKVHFTGTTQRLKNLRPEDYLQASLGILSAIKTALQKPIFSFQVSDFQPFDIKNIFVNTSMKIPPSQELETSKNSFFLKQDWWVSTSIWGSPSELLFLTVFSELATQLYRQFDEVFLIKNVKAVTLYHPDGKSSTPSFLLFCKNKQQIHQIFISPQHLSTHSTLFSLIEINKGTSLQPPHILLSFFDFFAQDSKIQLKNKLQDFFIDLF